MTIKELVDLIKSKHKGTWGNIKISEDSTRDRILYGNPEVECTGIVTTIYASVDVIRKAHELGANLIICHEALFWNHGDKTDWLENNKAFQMKKQLLDEYGIVVWRDHDYIHSGVNVDGKWVDGIFYGLMQVLDWQKYLIADAASPLLFKIDETSVEDLAQYLMEKMNLNGIRIMGNTEKPVSKVMIAFHIMGEADNSITKTVDEQDIDALITLEVTDYTTSEYIRDAAQLGLGKTILAIGHFNTEEPGMQWFAQYLPEMIGNDLQITYVQAGDTNQFIVRK